MLTAWLGHTAIFPFAVSCAHYAFCLRGNDWLSCFAVALVCRIYFPLPSPANPPENDKHNATHERCDAKHCAGGKFGGHDAEKHQEHTKSNEAGTSLTAL